MKPLRKSTFKVANWLSQWYTSAMVFDTLNYNTTFGPPFVSVKVSQHISVCNLFSTPKRPACAVSLPVPANPLYINVGPGRHGHCTGEQRNVKCGVTKSWERLFVLITSSIEHYVEGCSAGCVSAGLCGPANGWPNVWGKAMWPWVYPGSHLYLRRFTMETLSCECR